MASIMFGQRIPQRGFILSLFGIILIPIVLTQSVVLAAESPVLVYGPVTFEQTQGNSKYSETFSVTALAHGPYTLVVEVLHSADKGKEPKAKITLNGSAIIGASDFKKGVQRIERVVDLRLENELVVHVVGPKGGSINISITGSVGADTGVGYLGSTGGEVFAPSGARFRLQPDILEGNITAALRDVPESSLPLQLPDGFSFLGALELDLAGQQLLQAGKLGIPSPTNSPLNAIVARVVDVNGTPRLTITDTASNADGFLETNTPPFDGVLLGGLYLFLDMPYGLGLLGFTTLSENNQPIAAAVIELMTLAPGSAGNVLIRSSLEAQHVFVGISGSNGFTAVPSALPGTTIAAFGYQFMGESNLLGVGGPINLPDPPGWWFADVVDILLEDLSGIPLDDLPAAYNCPCRSLVVNPANIPFSAGTLFSPGDSIQLAAYCNSNDVTRSPDPGSIPSSAAELITALLSGGVYATMYGSENESIATVDQSGLVTGVQDGDTYIEVWNECMTLSQHGLTPCHAYGYANVSVRAPTPTPTATHTAISIGTETETPTATPTETLNPTDTASPTPTVTLTSTVMATLTSMPTGTPGHTAAYDILDTGVYGYVYALNDLEQVLLSDQTLGNILWTRSGNTPVNGMGSVSDLNDLGQVAGSANGRTAIWQGGGVIILDLFGLNPEDQSSTGVGLNNSSQVVGKMIRGNWDGYAPGLWPGPAPENVYYLSSPLSHSCDAIDINDLGEIIMRCTYYLERYHNLAFYLESFSAVSQYLPVVDGSISYPFEINNSGQIIGVMNAMPIIWENGSFQIIDSSISPVSDIAINDLGQVAGYASSTASDGSDIYFPFVGTKSHLFDVNTLIDPASGWQILTVLDINNSGQMVCEAVQNGSYYTIVLLTPV